MPKKKPRVAPLRLRRKEKTKKNPRRKPWERERKPNPRARFSGADESLYWRTPAFIIEQTLAQIERNKRRRKNAEVNRR